MHHSSWLLIGILVIVPALSLLARAIGVPYPIVLVLGGLPLAFIPGVPQIELDPELVLVVFLPPLLYAAAFLANVRELRADARAITLLAFPLVLFTTTAVAMVVHVIVDGIPWAAAFTVGAIVSPTDPVAATAIFRRLGAPRRLVAVVEGESLVNDSSALIVFRVAVAAAVGGTFSLAGAATSFVLAVAGGVAIGLGVGWVVAEVRRRIDDVPVEITISLLTGYAAYLIAEEVGASGVLAAVTAGLYLGWRGPRIASAATRVSGFAVWEFGVYLVNAVIFVLIGLQLRAIVDELADLAMSTVVVSAVAVIATVIGARLVWMFTAPYVVRALDRRPSQVARRASARLRVLQAWSGMRGAVTLAAALSIPLTTDTGAPFPQRPLIVFLAYVVVLFTIVVQGLTLPVLLRRLAVRGDDAEQREELEGRIRAADAALVRLEELAVEDWVPRGKVDRLRSHYAFQRARFEARATGEAADGFEDRSEVYDRLVRELIDVQRDVVVQLRNDGRISSDVMHRLERELDLEETRLENDGTRP
jgi:Na+/H+ antiporter